MVGKVGGGGKKGGLSSSKGAQGAGSTKKNAFVDRVDKPQATLKSAAAVATEMTAVDPMSGINQVVLQVVGQLKSGEIKTKQEAARRVIDRILRDRVKLQSKSLTDRIAQDLENDPRLSATLERLWAQGE